MTIKQINNLDHDKYYKILTSDNSFICINDINEPLKISKIEEPNRVLFTNKHGQGIYVKLYRIKKLILI